ncbi:GMC family oxidoreductase [Sphingomonas sp. Leaf339]|uniref:GMC family oxidoreductase n=1 Tax=Sphingomonas sp. Leaf339 TaxID=1736343 RepID=UPI000AF3BE55|nr:GMC family oxidoreductase [Sphingomonas sp. Leaf339]
MKLDHMRRYAATDMVDAVVIGTGAGGAPLLARLAQAGLKVVALEAGPNWEPGDHTPDETAASDIYWMDERLSDGAMPQAFGGNNSGTGVGGSTLHWGAFCPRPDARDLRLQSLTGDGVDWPIRHDELIAYIEEVERFIGVSGPADYPWDKARRYPLPPVARNASADAMAAGCAALGIATTDAPAAVVSRDWQQEGGDLRQACVNCGTCHQGCRNAAKTSMDTTYLPLAVGHGAEIRPGCMATGVERDARGRVTAVVYVRDGIEHRQHCGAVFLCGGGVETPRLLLHLGLANSSGQVGRNFMAHVATQVWGRFDAEMRCNRGYPSSLISEDMVRAAGADFTGGYLMQSLGVLPMTLATTIARGGRRWGRGLTALMDDYLHLAGIGINGECLPHDDNRLTLADETDAFGLPKARVTFGYNANEQAIDAHATDTMTAIWRAAGAQDIMVLPRAAHTIGTCRMGDNGDVAVVDPWGRSFDIDNLWICDNSIFPSSLAANPALTIMALSLRTADRFLKGA